MATGTGTGTLAEKLKLSMASPCALPVESVICQTSHKAAPGGQLVMVWFHTLRFVWFSGEVPSTATPSCPSATAGKFTLRAGRKHGRGGRKRVGAGQVHEIINCQRLRQIRLAPHFAGELQVHRVKVMPVPLTNLAPNAVPPVELVASSPRRDSSYWQARN